jgi:hypothetical protein
VEFKNAKIILPNFSGRPTHQTARGDRNFTLLLDEETANSLIKKRWPVKHVENEYWVKISVGYSNRSPRVIVINSGEETELTESTINMLDTVEIDTAEVEIFPYEWVVGRRTGVKPFLSKLIVTAKPST